MALVDQVIARLKTAAPHLRTVDGAASLAALMQSNALPQAEVGAHVITLGLQGGAADAVTGAFTQMLDELIGVVITFRTHDRVGAADQTDVAGLIRDTITALIGWSPNDEIGVFRFVRGGLTAFNKGTIVYLLEFSITDQLRIFA